MFFHWRLPKKQEVHNCFDKPLTNKVRKGTIYHRCLDQKIDILDMV